MCRQQDTFIFMVKAFPQLLNLKDKAYFKHKLK